MDCIVYHGSPNGNIKSLKANVSTHRKECIYATDNKAVAMMFMARDNGDLDTVKLIDNGIPVLVERRPGILERLYSRSGYIYELSGETFSHYDYLWKPEVISFEKEIFPLNVEYHENILSSLKKMNELGLLKLYEYPNRPENIPLDNSDLIDKYIYFQSQGISHAIQDLLNIYPEFAEQVSKKIANKESEGKTR